MMYARAKPSHATSISGRFLLVEREITPGMRDFVQTFLFHARQTNNIYYFVKKSLQAFMYASRRTTPPLQSFQKTALHPTSRLVRRTPGPNKWKTCNACCAPRMALLCRQRPRYQRLRVRPAVQATANHRSGPPTVGHPGQPHPARRQSPWWKMRYRCRT